MMIYDMKYLLKKVMFYSYAKWPEDGFVCDVCVYCVYSISMYIYIYMNDIYIYNVGVCALVYHLHCRLIDMI